jgi:hypothetical protein
METYQPNFNDPRVRKRVQKALEFATHVFLGREELQLSKNRIDHPKHFGSSRNPLSKWLRQLLLTVTDNHYCYTGDNQFSKTYSVNHRAVVYLQQRLKGTTTVSWAEFNIDAAPEKINTPLPTTSTTTDKQQSQEIMTELMFARYRDEIATGNFSMYEKSNREWHRLQTIPSSHRKRRFAQEGYIYDYDLEAAAPTLLLQRARHMGLNKPTPMMDYYLSNKTLVRNVIAKECGINYQQAKSVITSILQGGVLSAYSDNKTFRDILNSNSVATNKLQSNDIITALRGEVSLMWRTITKDIPREVMTTKTGKQQRRRISSKQKSEIYRQEEQRVMKEIKRWIKKKEPMARVMTEHDGWRSDTMMDVIDVIDHVRRTTGYDIKIEWNKITP